VSLIAANLPKQSALVPELVPASPTRETRLAISALLTVSYMWQREWDSSTFTVTP
jgi:hypothetical protein